MRVIQEVGYDFHLHVSPESDSAVVYDGRPGYVQTPSQPYIVRPDSRARQEYLPSGGPQVTPGGPQAYGWNPSLYDQPGYNAYPAPPAAYPPPAEAPYPHGAPPAQPPYGDPNAYPGARPQSVYSPVPPQGYPGPTPYGAPVDTPVSQGYPASPVQHHPHVGGGPPPGPHVAPEPTPQPQIYPQPGVQPEHHQPQVYPQPGLQAEPQIQPQPQVQPQVQVQSQPQVQAQPQGQPQVQPQPQAQLQQQQQAQAPAQQEQLQAQPQPQPQQASQQASPVPSQQQSGPPYVYDPNTTYADPNVQAWAQYYAHGGTDPTGSVYFISVPGVKEGPPAPAPVRTLSGDSIASQQHQDASAIANVGQVAPLHINKAQPVESQPQSQSGVYGASPYAPAATSAGPTSPVAGEGPPVAGQPYYGLANQFASMEIGGDGRQNGQQGPPGVGATA